MIIFNIRLYVLPVTFFTMVDAWLTFIILDGWVLDVHITFTIIAIVWNDTRKVNWLIRFQIVNVWGLGVHWVESLQPVQGVRESN